MPANKVVELEGLAPPLYSAPNGVPLLLGDSSIKWMQGRVSSPESSAHEAEMFLYTTLRKMVGPVGVEPTSSVLQTDVSTGFTKVP